MMLVLWVYSLIRRDASVVDPWWSMGFLAITLILLRKAPLTPSRTALLGLVAIWALRLWAYLLWRSRGKGEDPRYRAFRERYGPKRYWWISLFQVFGLQGVLMLVISAPLQVAATRPWPDLLQPGHLLGAALVGVGVVLEALADAQLAAFRASGSGGVLQSGLWRYSRHPNYFGESLVWWGFWLYSLPAGGGWTVFSPLLMTYLLVRVSGVAMLEPALRKKRPEYEDYIRRTSAFLPWPPRQGH